MNLQRIDGIQNDAWYSLRYGVRVYESGFWVLYWDGRAWGVAARVRQALIYKLIERLKGVLHG